MSEAVRRRHELVDAKRPEGLSSLLANDVEFHSPVMFAPQKGKADSELYLTAAFHVLFNDSFRYVRQMIGERDAALEFELELDDVHINGVDLITWNQENQITSFK
ncbi:MAG: nuclear transport factor 2 family protein [Actinomycetota bacterium]